MRLLEEPDRAGTFLETELMSKIDHTCPRCESVMEEGYMLDRGPHGSSPSVWVEGRLVPREPQTLETLTKRLSQIPKRLVENLSQLVSQSKKSRQRRRIRIRTLRCTECGFLESYASPE